jgi:hypothetical protein
MGRLILKAWVTFPAWHFTAPNVQKFAQFKGAHGVAGALVYQLRIDGTLLKWLAC